MLQVRFYIPIFMVASAMPMVRTNFPLMELGWHPNTCSTRARTFERVLAAS